MRVFIGLAFFVLGLGILPGVDNIDPCWPLAKGAYWIYEGDVSWVEKDPATGQNQVNHKHLTWRSEVTDVVEAPGAIMFHGFPTDLAWYNSKTQPSYTLILRAGTDYYQVRNHVAEVFQKLKNPDNQPNLDTAELLLPTPLALGKKFGMGNTISELFNYRYCYLVENVAPFDLRSVKHAPRLNHPLRYSITWHSNPDNDQIDFVPGLGITSYSYLHHGTTMEVNVHLVECGIPSVVKKPEVKALPSLPD